MYRYILLLVASMVYASTACNQTKQAASQAPQSDERLEEALLWKIEGKDIHTSYVFGTIHLIDEEDYFLPTGTSDVLEQSGTVVFEIDMDDMSDLSSQLSLFTKAFMPNGLTLKDLLSEEDYNDVNAFFQDMGLPMFIMGRLKPMFLSVFATGDVAPDDLSSGAWKSYEMEFYETAQDNDIPVEGLETLEYQMSIFDSIPYAEQAEMLVDMIKSQDAGSEEFDKLIAAYKAQDIELLSELVNSPDGGIGDHEDVLIRKRNENWIPVMGEFMKDENTFFAVGAGHLAGKYGVIRLLRSAGYTVTPVRLDAAGTGKGRI